LTSTLRQLNDEMAELVDKIRESLVMVSNGRRGAGAGIIWHSDGLIITNAHVIRHNNTRVALADGRKFEARLLARDEKMDLAALSIQAENLPAIDLGNSDDVKPGQFVLALGHPWGIKSAATCGIIMGYQGEHFRVSFAQNFLPVNLPLRPGNSGGPLVDMEGRLLGINSIMTGPDAGLSIPVNSARSFLNANQIDFS
jgi:serine protease Do